MAPRSPTIGDVQSRRRVAMELRTRKVSDKRTDERTDERTDDLTMQLVPNIFGLRYLEEEETEIYDVVGCRSNRTCGDDYIVVS
jgi:hypothetical protein